MIIEAPFQLKGFYDPMHVVYLWSRKKASQIATYSSQSPWSGMVADLFFLLVGMEKNGFR